MEQTGQHTLLRKAQRDTALLPKREYIEVLCPAGPPHVQHGTERLREWMAARLLKPLVRAIDGAHTHVIETAARIGWQGVQLQPLEGQSGASRAPGEVDEATQPVSFSLSSATWRPLPSRQLAPALFPVQQAGSATTRTTSWWCRRCGSSCWRACARWAACSRRPRRPRA